MNRFYVAVSTLFLISCTAGEDLKDKVDQRCKVWSEEACRSCESGERDEFKFCYYDSNKYSEPKVVREDCIGVHVGFKCEPCESIFALNFGGSLTEVDCAGFFKALEERNVSCNNCIKESTALQ